MINEDDDVSAASVGSRLMVEVMSRSHTARFAYLLAGAALLLVVGGGGGLALYFHGHLGVPPAVLVVADRQVEATTATVLPPASPTQTPEPIAVVPVPPPLPDGVGYTAAPMSTRADLYNTDGYGWLTSEGARCPSDAVMAGRTPETLFVICRDGAGYFFRSTALKDNSTMEVGQLVRSDDGFAGSQRGRTVSVSASRLTVGADGEILEIQDVVQSWNGSE